LCSILSTLIRVAPWTNIAVISFFQASSSLGAGTMAASDPSVITDMILAIRLAPVPGAGLSSRNKGTMSGREGLRTAVSKAAVMCVRDASSTIGKSINGSFRSSTAACTSSIVGRALTVGIVDPSGGW